MTDRRLSPVLSQSGHPGPVAGVQPFLARVEPLNLGVQAKPLRGRFWPFLDTSRPKIGEWRGVGQFPGSWVVPGAQECRKAGKSSILAVLQGESPPAFKVFKHQPSVMVPVPDLNGTH